MQQLGHGDNCLQSSILPKREESSWVAADETVGGNSCGQRNSLVAAARVSSRTAANSLKTKKQLPISECWSDRLLLSGRQRRQAAGPL